MKTVVLLATKANTARSVLKITLVWSVNTNVHRVRMVYVMKISARVIMVGLVHTVIRARLDSLAQIVTPVTYAFTVHAAMVSVVAI